MKLNATSTMTGSSSVIDHQLKDQGSKGMQQHVQVAPPEVEVRITIPESTSMESIPVTDHGAVVNVQAVKTGFANCASANIAGKTKTLNIESCVTIADNASARANARIAHESEALPCAQLVIQAAPRRKSIKCTESCKEELLLPIAAMSVHTAETRRTSTIESCVIIADNASVRANAHSARIAKGLCCALVVISAALNLLVCLISWLLDQSGREMLRH